MSVPIMISGDCDREDLLGLMTLLQEWSTRCETPLSVAILGGINAADGEALLGHLEMAIRYDDDDRRRGGMFDVALVGTIFGCLCRAMGHLHFGAKLIT
jgi:hypothetical protein